MWCWLVRFWLLMAVGSIMGEWLIGYFVDGCWFDTDGRWFDFWFDVNGWCILIVHGYWFYSDCWLLMVGSVLFDSDVFMVDSTIDCWLWGVINVFIVRTIFFLLASETSLFLWQCFCACLFVLMGDGWWFLLIRYQLLIVMRSTKPLSGSDSFFPCLPRIVFDIWWLLILGDDCRTRRSTFGRACFSRSWSFARSCLTWRTRWRTRGKDYFRCRCWIISYRKLRYTSCEVPRYWSFDTSCRARVAQSPGVLLCPWYVESLFLFYQHFCWTFLSVTTTLRKALRVVITCWYDVPGTWYVVIFFAVFFIFTREYLLFFVSTPSGSVQVRYSYGTTTAPALIYCVNSNSGAPYEPEGVRSRTCVVSEAVIRQNFTTKNCSVGARLITVR